MKTKTLWFLLGMVAVIGIGAGTVYYGVMTDMAGVVVRPVGFWASNSNAINAVVAPVSSGTGMQTNEFTTAIGLTLVGYTNGLAGTNWVDQYFYPRDNPAGYVTATVTNGLGPDPSVTNGLASTNWVGLNFYLKSNPSNYVTASVTNELAATNWVGANYYPLANPSNYVSQLSSNAAFVNLTNLFSFTICEDTPTPFADHISLTNDQGSLCLIDRLSTYANSILKAGQFVANDAGFRGNGTALTNDDGNPFITHNQTITLSGDASGSGSTSISATVNNVRGTLTNSITGNATTATGAQYATNTPNGGTISGLNGTNTWTGTNTFSTNVWVKAPVHFGGTTTQTLAVLSMASANPSFPASTWVSAGNPLAFCWGETTSGNGDFILGFASATANARNAFIGRRSKNTMASPAAVASGDSLFIFLSSGFDGAAFQNPAGIEFLVDGTVSSSVVPTKVSIMTGNNGSGRTERMAISSAGSVTVYSNLNVSGPIISTNFIVGGYGCLTMATGTVSVATSASTNLFLAYSYADNFGSIGIETNANFVTTNAGRYRISFGCSMKGGNGDDVKTMVFTNGVHCGVITFEKIMQNPAIAETGFKEFTVTTPALCRISLQIANGSVTSTEIQNLCFNVKGAN